MRLKQIQIWDTEQRLIIGLDSPARMSLEREVVVMFISCWTVRSSCSSPWLGLSWPIVSDGLFLWPGPATCPDPGRQLLGPAPGPAQPERTFKRLLIWKELLISPTVIFVCVYQQSSGQSRSKQWGDCSLVVSPKLWTSLPFELPSLPAFLKPHMFRNYD